MMRKTATSTLPLFHRSCALALTCLTAFSPAVAASGATIPGYYSKLNLPAPAANTLPVLKTTPSGATVDQSGNQLTVTQNQGNANVVIDWSSFNIGSASTVRFYQGSGTPGTASWKANSSYAALNRIYDQNPSQIYGKIKADGSIYLINRNGILFGPGSTVDVHTLTASALTLYVKDFQNGLNSFTVDPYTDGGPSSTLGQDTTIANFGTITTDAGGAITLIGPQVENGGSLIAPSGTVSLIGAASHSGLSLGGPDVLLSNDYENGNGSIYVAYNSNAAPGVAINHPNGSIITDYGRVGMYGSTVQQLGRIRAITALKQSGEIYLQATNSVTTGADSETSTPVSDSTDAAISTFTYSPGKIAISGIYTTTTAKLSLNSTGGFANPPQQAPLLNIDHEGSITSPSGSVSMEATNSIYLGQGSSIDVSGLWITLPASANILESQLNSAQLADFYSQKSGTLKGKTISTSLLNGTSIGNINDSYTESDLTAQERSTKGGTISLGSTSEGTLNYTLNNIIVRQGATLNFSGGGFSYQAGNVSTSMLKSGSNAYSIDSASQTIQYDSLLDEQTVSYSRFGVQRTFTGLYLGGGTPLLSNSPARQDGSDAGSLSLISRTLVLDGTLKGSATRGLYQNATTVDTTDNTDAHEISVARGLEIPKGGTLQIGIGDVAANNGSNDHIVDSITLSAQTTPLPTTFAPGDTLNSSQTVLSTAILNNAGLGTIDLYTNTTFSSEKGAVLNLASGSTLNVIARRIEQQGEVVIPDGTVTYSLEDNVSSYQLNDGQANSLYVPLVSGVDFAAGSVVSVRGLAIDNSKAGQAVQGTQNTTYTSGGSITVQDKTDTGVTTGNNLVLAPTAVLDVSGGYLINTSGKLTGGNAGKLSLTAMNISLGGELEGFAVAGANGGTISLQSGEIVVGKVNGVLPASEPFDASPPDYMQGKLLLADDRFSDTGFTNFTLNAVNDVTFTSGATLEPSTVRLTMPATWIALNNSAAPKTADPVYDKDYMGSTSISATAGALFKGSTSTGTQIYQNLDARLTLSEGTTLKTSPGGSITLTAPAAIDINGTVESLGGTINVTAGSTSTPGDITVSGYGKIVAAGYNKIDTSVVSGKLAGYLPQAAGTISLTASDGDVVLNNGSLLDVSGSQPVQRYVSGNGNEPAQVTVAGDAGELDITYHGGFTAGGVINAKPYLTGCNGGTLSIYRSNQNAPEGLQLASAMIDTFETSGFDAFTFKSPTAITFENDFTHNFRKSLTLDAPNIYGNGTDISISSPWVKLINSDNKTPRDLASASAATGGTLSITAGDIDVTGTKTIQGFSDVSLSATHFITLADFQDATGAVFNGTLSVAGNLTLKARSIYPTTASQFTVNVADKFTTLASDSGPIDTIYSAGGSLSINTGINSDGSVGFSSDDKVTVKTLGGIENDGYLFAPQGTINLNSNGRIFLAKGSKIVTSGSVPVYYGDTTGTSWLVNDISGSGGTAVTSAPSKSISITGNEVIAQSGSLVESNGGGGIYTTLYQKGLNGSSNPLSLYGRFVILSDQSLTLPGTAVYLEAIPSLGLKAGVYSVLTGADAIKYAFLPGALVVQDAGNYSMPGGQYVTSQGYAITSGYNTFIGNLQTSDVFKSYIVRTAASVLQEGDFTKYSYTSTNSGNITVNATTTGILASKFSSVPLSGGTGGVFTLNGSSLEVKSQIDSLPEGFDYSSAIPQNLAGTVQIQADSVSGKGWGEISLGSKGTDSNGNIIYNTSSIVVNNGVTLEAGSVSFVAGKDITLESGGQITALGGSGSGTISVDTPNGTLSVAQSAQMHATNGIALKANSYSLHGDTPFLVDSGSLSLTANTIVIAADNSPQAKDGLYPTEKQWETFLNNKSLSLISSTDIEFWKDVNVKASGTLILDTGSISGTGSVNVSITAATGLTLQNTGSTIAATSSSTGELTLNAANIGITSNSSGIDLSGFKTTTISSLNDLAFTGTGTLTTGNLNVQAAGLTVAPSRASDGTYTTGNFAITAGGDIAITSSAGTHTTPTTTGGNLSITGDSVLLSSLIDIPGGTVSISATNSGITLANGGHISVKGALTQTSDSTTTVPMPAGSVTMSAASGAIDIDAGSSIDVSAATGGDAGKISLSAPNGVVTIKTGGILGASAGGQGASLTIDSKDLSGVGGLDGLTSLVNGGFTKSLAIHSHSGDLSLDEGATLTAKNVTISADNNALSISGTINADTNDGSGMIELNAGTDLNLSSGSLLSAKGLNGADGGDIYLNSQGGTLSFQKNSVIDTSSSASGTSGTISFRAQQTATGVNLDLSGSIAGASKVVAEGFSIYNYGGDITANLTGALSDANTYMTNYGTAIRNSLLSSLQMPTGWDVSNFHFRPGIEIDSKKDSNGNGGDISVSALDLTSNKYTITSGSITLSEPGILTLRAEGNLNIVTSLVDHPSITAASPTTANFTALTSKTMKDSWGFNLVAGADLSSANPMGVVTNPTTGTGNLVLGPMTNGQLTVTSAGYAKGGAKVYSENGLIRFASGGDTYIGSGVAAGYMINKYMLYNIGSYGGKIIGSTGGSLVFMGGAIQTAVSDIDLSVGKDLDLDLVIGTLTQTHVLGAIRTTGEYTYGSSTASPDGSGSSLTNDAQSYWTYADGGNITLNIGGNLSGYTKNVSAVNATGADQINTIALSDAWDAPINKMSTNFYYLTANYGDSTRTANDTGAYATEGIATMAGGSISIETGGKCTSQIGLFGQGNLSIRSGGNVNGRFRVSSGTGNIYSLGNFGLNGTDQQIELCNSQTKIVAAGDMYIGAILNPDNTRTGLVKSNHEDRMWNLTYGLDTRISLVSLTGSISVSGASTYAGYIKDQDTSIYQRDQILPPFTEFIAAQDISLANSFYLAPAPTGNIRVIAGGSIEGVSTGSNAPSITMADIGTDAVYQQHYDLSSSTTTASDTQNSVISITGSSLLHTDDTTPVQIISGGNFSNVGLYLNKKAEVLVKGDITELDYRGQNLADTDITVIQAGGDITYTYNATSKTDAAGILQGGPGALVVQAGGNIDLGSSSGIVSEGNYLNSSLGSTGAALYVVAGAKTTLTPLQMQTFFNGDSSSSSTIAADGLRNVGTEFSSLLASGQTASARDLLNKARVELIQPMFDEPSATQEGSIDLVKSQITSLGTKADVTVMARSTINVGTSSTDSSSATGITTAGGGNIDIFAGSDINVNLSRIMTFFGGDITVWSDQGDINAGRGSKTAVSVPKVKTVANSSGKGTHQEFTPPAVGSGIRAVTFDPNQYPGGPLEIPVAGDIYLFAPQGAIDAGEAGIAGGKVVLGATEVLNSQNISAAAGSVGVPSASEGSIGIGSLSGTSGLADSSKMIEQTSGAGAARDALKSTTQVLDDFMAKFLDVKVISFDDDDSTGKDKDKDKR